MTGSKGSRKKLVPTCSNPNSVKQTTQASGKVTWPNVCLSFRTARQSSASTSNSREGQGLTVWEGLGMELAHGCHLLWTITSNMCVHMYVENSPRLILYTFLIIHGKEFHILKSKSRGNEPLHWNSAELPHSLFYSVTQRHNEQINNISMPGTKCQGKGHREDQRRHGTSIPSAPAPWHANKFKIIYFRL